jgi:hypothetical protein
VPELLGEVHRVRKGRMEGVMRKMWGELKEETMTAAERKKLRGFHDLALEAFKVAVRKALRERRRLGLPIWVERNGKVVNINPKKRGGKTKKKRET